MALLGLAACSHGSGGGGATGGTGGTGNPDLDLTGPFAVDEAGGRIYFAIEEGIRSATLDGNDARTVFAELERTPTSLSIDPSTQRLVWTDGHRVFAGSSSGGAVEDLAEGSHVEIAPGSQAVYVARYEQGIFELSAGGEKLVIEAPVERDIAVSESANKLFWIQGAAIYEAPLAGGTPSLVAGTEESDATQLDVDPDTGELYYRSSFRTFRLPSGSTTPIRMLDDMREPIHVDVLAGSRIYWSSREYQEFWFADVTSQAEMLVEDADGLGEFTVDEAHQKLFWVKKSSVHVADLDGKNPTPLLVGINGKIERVRTDPGGQKVYVRTSHSLARANLDGTGVEILVADAQDGSTFIGGLEVGADIALDVANQKLYWTIEDPVQSSQHAIVRGNLDGSSAAQFPGIALASHSPLDLDAAGGKLYFQTKTGLGRANLDGSGVEITTTSGIGTVIGLRVDPAGQKLYILEPKRLLSTDLALQNLEVVLDLPSSAYGLSFDASAGFLYYRPISGELRRLDVATPGATPNQIPLPAALSTLTGSFTVTNGTLYLGTQDFHVARFDVTGPTSAPLDIILPRVSSPSSVAVIGETLYWTDNGAAWIAAADLDGKQARIVHDAPVTGGLTVDPAGGGLFFTGKSGLFRLDVDTGTAEQLDTNYLRSLTASPTDLYFIPVNDVGIPGNSPSILKWTAGDTSKLIDPDTWYGGMPRTLAWGEAKLYCVDTVGVLTALSSDGTSVETIALIPDAAKVSMRSAHFQTSTRSLYYALPNAIYRYPVPDSPRVKLLFTLD